MVLKLVSSMLGTCIFDRSYKGCNISASFLDAEKTATDMLNVIMKEEQEKEAHGMNYI